jgi:hypothetical protein
MVVIISIEGAGKNSFLDTFVANVLGQWNYYETANPLMTLFSRFGAGRFQRVLVNIDEARGSDLGPAWDEVKNAVTSSHYNHEVKNVNPVTVTNTNHFIVTTNNEAPVKDGRRVFIMTASPAKAVPVVDKAYFDHFYAYMADPRNAKAIVEFLRARDVTNKNWISSRPQSDAQDMVRTIGASPWELLLASLYRRNADVPGATFVIEGRAFGDAAVAFATEVLKWRDVKPHKIRVQAPVYVKTMVAPCCPGAITPVKNYGRRKLNVFVFDRVLLKAYLDGKGLLAAETYDEAAVALMPGAHGDDRGAIDA